MPHALTATASDPSTTTVTVPDGGDARTAASVVTPTQALLNGIAWLRGVLVGAIAQTVTVNGALGTVSQDITAGANLVAVADVIADRDATANRDVSAGRNLAVAGTSTLSGRIAFTGSGRPTNRLTVHTSAAAWTANVSTGTDYYTPSGAAGSTVTIDDTGAVDGDYFDFSTQEGTNITAIHAPGGGTIVLLQLNTGQYAWAHVVRISGVWTFVRGARA